MLNIEKSREVDLLKDFISGSNTHFLNYTGATEVYKVRIKPLKSQQTPNSSHHTAVANIGKYLIALCIVIKK